jgi:uncharacterized protein (TIGR04255 family)
MTSSTLDPLRLEFSRLPLVEAALRASFSQALPVTYKSIISAHDRLRKQFAELAEPTEFDVPPGIEIEPSVLFGPDKLPGVIFSGNDRGLTVGLNRHLFLSRWRQRPGGENQPPYPRFDALRDALWGVVDAYLDVCGISAVPTVVNMSYVNFIRVTDHGTVLERYFTERAQCALTKGSREVRKVEVAWQEDESSIDLRFSLQQMSAQVGGEKLDGYRLTTAAGLRVPESATGRPELESVHNRLQHFFTALISDRAKSEWGLEEKPNG